MNHDLNTLTAQELHAAIKSAHYYRNTARAADLGLEAIDRLEAAERLTEAVLDCLPMIEDSATKTHLLEVLKTAHNI